MKKTIEERFWEKVDSPNRNGCRLWLAGTNAEGYGWFKGDKEPELAHRVALRLMGIVVPVGMEVHHDCPGGPNKSCVEISHLRIVTRQEHRQLDCIGEKNHSAKVCADDVRWLRWVYADGRYTQQQLADCLGVCRQTIGEIVRLEIWQHIL